MRNLLLLFVGGWLMMTGLANASAPGEIYFAGGCFWGVEEYFSRIPGVLEVESGYANGKTMNPSYEEVCSGEPGHAETVRVAYDPGLVSLPVLVKQFFGIIDPLSLNKQGNDRGIQYRTGIYYTNQEDQPILAELMQEEQQKYDKPIAVELMPLANYSRAEEYHQDYLRKNPRGYCHIKFDSLKDLPSIIDESRYPLPSDSDLRQQLSPQEYEITRKSATEPAFTGKYWNNKKKGLYVDVVTGEPLFVSSDKFESRSGWPSFTRPVDPKVLRLYQDQSHGMNRIEVRSRSGNSHLGHVFPDGPAEKGGLRYCINSGALRFIPLEEMEHAGYGYLLNLVK